MYATTCTLSLWLLLTATPLAAQGPLHDPDDRALLAAHYARVECELRAVDTSSLRPEQRAERLRLIDCLRAYRERGDFGLNTDFPDQRMPYLVDRDGRRCAVANLLDRSDLGAVTLELARTHNHLWVAELHGDSQFHAWLERSGLTFAEAARVQAPPRNGAPPRRPPRVWSEPSPQPSRPALPGSAPRYDGPADASPRTAPASARRPTTPRPDWATPRTAGPAVAASATTAPRPAGIPLTDESIDWNTWWQWNRRDVLLPNPLNARLAPPTGAAAGDDDGRAFHVLARRNVTPLLAGHLDHGDPEVRAAATVAVGRIAGRDAVSQLLRKLADPSLGVRQDAILALGATGSALAVHTLLHVAHRGTHPTQHGDAISPFARPFAILALGLAQRNDHHGSLDELVARLVRRLNGREREDAGVAAFLFASLSPSAELRELAFEVAPDEATPTTLRCSAYESLRAGRDEASLVHLVRALSGRRLEVRRSAAIALGTLDHGLALAPLQTAFELERELLTRALILISIGRRGGPAARAFLLEELGSGRKALRPWSALALGLLARGRSDPDVCRAVRKAYSLETNQHGKGAYLIASGLLQDQGAVRDLLEVLSTSRNVELRICAAEALVMIRGAGVRNILRARAASDPCGATRVAIAEVLGYLGNSDDATLLTAMLRDTDNPEHRSAITAALGYLGSVQALDELTRLARARDTHSAVRAAAIAALGLVLTERPGLRLAGSCRHANFTQFPDWLLGALRLTL